jgi:hypothetical protein
MRQFWQRLPSLKIPQEMRLQVLMLLSVVVPVCKVSVKRGINERVRMDAQTAHVRAKGIREMMRRSKIASCIHIIANDYLKSAPIRRSRKETIFDAVVK